MTDVDSIAIAFDEGSLTTLKIVAVAIAGQFLLLPAITFVLTLVLGVRGSVALGMILVACCPPGNVSNILTHRARGDVALSVSMTAVGNVLAIFLLPLNFAFWGGLHPSGKDFLETVEVGWWDMLSEILLVIGIPFVLGITIARLWPAFAAKAHPVVGKVSFLALAAIIAIGIANNWDVFTEHIGVRATRAMTFEVGIRNAGFDLLLVFELFDGLGGMALVAAWWGIWDIIAGLTVATIWSRRTVRDEVAA